LACHLDERAKWVGLGVASTRGEISTGYALFEEGRTHQGTRRKRLAVAPKAQIA
jgi:hypothetical protein